MIGSDSHYPDSVDEINNDNLGDIFVRDALLRVIDFKVPYAIYVNAFQSHDGFDRSANECASLLGAIVAAAIWGAENSSHVLTVDELDRIESLDDAEPEEEGGDE